MSAATPGRAGLRGTVVVALGAAAAAAGIRIAVLADMRAANPLFRAPLLDEAGYLAAARGEAQPTLLSGVWPALLRAVGATTLERAQNLNVGIGAATAALAAIAATRLTGSLAAGAVAGGLVAASGVSAFLDTTAQIEPLAALVVTSAVAAIIAAARKETLLRIATAAALIGLATAVRGTQAALLLGLAPVVLRRLGTDPQSGPPRLARAAAAVGGFVVAIGLIHGTVGAVPSSAGVNVWLGNNTYSRRTLSFGTDLFAMDPVTEERETLRIAASSGASSGVAGANAWWTTRALREMADAPADAAAHLAKKTVLAFSADEIGGIHDVYAERTFSPWTRSFLPVSAWIFLALGAAGFVLARSRFRGTTAAGVACVAFLGATVLIFPLGRYRAPLVPAAAILAAAGLIARRDHLPARREKIAAVLAFTAVAVAAAGALVIRPRTRPEAWTNLAVASRTADASEAERLAALAVAEDPSYAPARVLLGDLLLSRRMSADALRHFEAASGHAVLLSRTVVWRDAQMGRARCLSNLGRHREALTVHDDARAEFPRDAALASEGALLAHAAGDREDALRRLAAAREISPDDPSVRDAAAALGLR